MKFLKGKKKNQEKKNCRLKKRLKDNKIFFETITSLLLSVMAIVVSVVSVSMQKEANELQEKQVLLAEQQNIPVFNVSYKYYEPYVENGISYPQGKEITIINNGGNIISGYLYATKQIKVVIHDEFYNEIQTLVIDDTSGYVKRNSYYNAQNKSFTIKKHDTTRDIYLLALIKEQLIKEYKNYVFSIYYLDYMDIEYTDLRNESHNEYYELNVGELSKTSFKEYEYYKSLHMTSMTDEEICSVIKKMVGDVLLPK